MNTLPANNDAGLLEYETDYCALCSSPFTLSSLRLPSRAFAFRHLRKCRTENFELRKPSFESLKNFEIYKAGSEYCAFFLKNLLDCLLVNWRLKSMDFIFLNASKFLELAL